MEKFIMAGPVALNVRDSGQGTQTIVLLHGYMESIRVWDDFAPLLESEFRIIAPDLPGHGISVVTGPVHTMEFLARVVHDGLVALGVGKCVVVGHSMGGYVALEMLRQFPEMLSGLVLLNSTPNADSEQKKEERAREADLIRAGKKELLARTHPAKAFAADNRKKFKEQITELSEQIAITEDEGIIALLGGMAARRDLNGVMRDSPVPQLVILGRGDEHITAPVAAELIGAQPQARVVWMEQSGHMAFIEQLTQTALAIKEFAKEVSS